jgi:hypothetical protein
MMTLIAAAALAAQPPPAPNAPAQQMPMQHEQHEGMKKDCCADCCKDMEAKMKDAHHAERGDHAGE